MKPLDAAGQGVAKFVGAHAETRAGQGRIVDVGFYHRAFGVDAQPGRHMRIHFQPWQKTLGLAYGVESEMRAAGHVCVDGGVGIRRTVCVSRRAKKLASELQFVERTGREGPAVLAEDAEGAPQGIGFERHDYFYAGAMLDVGDEVEIAADAVFIHHIKRCRQILCRHYIYVRNTSLRLVIFISGT